MLERLLRDDLWHFVGRDVSKIHSYHWRARRDRLRPTALESCQGCVQSGTVAPMIDLYGIRGKPPLRWLKWLCTLTASIAIMIGLGTALNWAVGGGRHVSAVIAAALVAVVALAARNAIAVKLDDKR